MSKYSRSCSFFSSGICSTDIPGLRSPPWQTQLRLQGCSSLGLPWFKLCDGADVASFALWRDAAAALFTILGAYLLVLAFDSIVKRGTISQALSQKLAHILFGVLFMDSWPLFSSSIEARFFATIAPILNTIRLLIHGLSLVKDDMLIKFITELLRGPLYYVRTLLLCELVYWCNSPIGLVSLCMLSVGDGFADIVGRHFGTVKLPYNDQKSWVGSMSMFLFGFPSSIL